MGFSSLSLSSSSMVKSEDGGSSGSGGGHRLPALSVSSVSTMGTDGHSVMSGHSFNKQHNQHPPPGTPPAQPHSLVGSGGGGGGLFGPIPASLATAPNAHNNNKHMGFSRSVSEPGNAPFPSPIGRQNNRVGGGQLTNRIISGSPQQVSGSSSLCEGSDLFSSAEDSSAHNARHALPFLVHNKDHSDSDGRERSLSIPDIKSMGMNPTFNTPQGNSGNGSGSSLDQVGLNLSPRGGRMSLGGGLGLSTIPAYAVSPCKSEGGNVIKPSSSNDGLYFMGGSFDHADNNNSNHNHHPHNSNGSNSNNGFGHQSPYRQSSLRSRAYSSPGPPDARAAAGGGGGYGSSSLAPHSPSASSSFSTGGVVGGWDSGDRRTALANTKESISASNLRFRNLAGGQIPELSSTEDDNDGSNLASTGFFGGVRRGVSLSNVTTNTTMTTLAPREEQQQRSVVSSDKSPETTTTDLWHPRGEQQQGHHTQGTNKEREPPPPGILPVSSSGDYQLSYASENNRSFSGSPRSLGSRDIAAAVTPVSSSRGGLGRSVSVGGLPRSQLSDLPLPEDITMATSPAPPGTPYQQLRHTMSDVSGTRDHHLSDHVVANRNSFGSNHNGGGLSLIDVNSISQHHSGSGPTMGRGRSYTDEYMQGDYLGRGGNNSGGGTNGLGLGNIGLSDGPLSPRPSYGHSAAALANNQAMYHPSNIGGGLNQAMQHMHHLSQQGDLPPMQHHDQLHGPPSGGGGGVGKSSQDDHPLYHIPPHQPGQQHQLQMRPMSQNYGAHQSQPPPPGLGDANHMQQQHLHQQHGSASMPPDQYARQGFIQGNGPYAPQPGQPTRVYVPGMGTILVSTGPGGENIGHLARPGSGGPEYHGQYNESRVAHGMNNGQQDGGGGAYPMSNGMHHQPTYPPPLGAHLQDGIPRTLDQNGIPGPRMTPPRSVSVGSEGIMASPSLSRMSLSASDINPSMAQYAAAGVLIDGMGNKLDDVHGGVPPGILVRSGHGAISSNSLSSSSSSIEQIGIMLPHFGGTASADTSTALSNIPNRLVYNVKFKRTQRSFILGPRAPRDIKVGCYVKVEADRGEDLGIVISRIPADKYNNVAGRASFRVSPGSVAEPSGAGAVDLKKLVRLATHDEIALLADKREEEDNLLKVCRVKVKQRGLPMNVVDAEYQFDRHKLIFFFEAEGRIDFRELVRDLFSIYKTRIWMQQLDKGGNSGFGCGNSIGGATSASESSDLADGSTE